MFEFRNLQEKLEKTVKDTSDAFFFLPNLHSSAKIIYSKASRSRYSKASSYTCRICEASRKEFKLCGFYSINNDQQQSREGKLHSNLLFSYLINKQLNECNLNDFTAYNNIFVNCGTALQSRTGPLQGLVGPL